jgi:CubicO group peptidase (beta-lactamase class C family)
MNRVLFLLLLSCSAISTVAQVRYEKVPMSAERVSGRDDNKVYEDELKPVQNLAQVGILDPYKLYSVDEFVNAAIAKGAFPGCRVVAAKDGQVFYDKAFGYQTFSAAKPVMESTVYDLASVTKVVSTTLAVMRLHEQGKLNLSSKLGEYLPITYNTDKASIIIRDLLLHQAGLKAWIPFYKAFYDSAGRLSPVIFHSVSDTFYNQEVAQNLWMRRDYRDTVWKKIIASPLENKGRMVYSDLDYYFLAAVVERITGKSIDRYVAEQFYIPMGLKSMGYNPLQYLPKDRIAPTENDRTFRSQLLQGYVHDPGAALFGGIAGHAGVFGTAQDVAALFQMLLYGGHYRGVTYFKKETVKLFAAYNSTISRRGLGFDKPSADTDDGGPAGNRCSGYSFGHQGFTGTCVWADPENGVVFVFLSNRVNPDAENSLINKLNVRTIVQDRLYNALNIPINRERPDVRNLQLKLGKYKTAQN